MSFSPLGSLVALRSRINQIVHELESIHEGATDGALTQTEQTRFEALSVELDSRERERDELERRERLTDSRARYGTIQVSGGPGPDLNMDVARAGSRDLRDATLRLLDSRDAGHLSGAQKARVERLTEKRTGDTDGDAVARLVIATSRPAYRSAFAKMISSGGPAFDAGEIEAINNVRSLQRAMGIGAGGTGGYAVPALIDPTLILTSQGTPNSILSLARVETITTDTWRGLSSAGVSWGFHAEGTEAGDNSPTVAQPSVTTRRADGFIPFSIEVGQDWPSFAADMATLLAEGYSELLVDKLTSGTAGSNEPNGLISSLDALTTPANIEVQTAGTLGAGDVYKLWRNLPVRFRTGASWMSSTDIENAIRQNGVTDPNFTVNMTAEGIPALFGKAYAENDYMNVLPAGTGTQPLLAVGDFKGYLVAQRAGMTVEYVPHLFGNTNSRPTGQRGFFAWARVGAGVVNPNAFRLLVNRSA